MTFSDVENLMIETIRDLNTFRIVDSAGRKAVPATLTYPAAFTCFVGARNAGVQSRRVLVEKYQVVVANRNYSSEKKAADTTYDYVTAVLDAIHGNTWDKDELDQMQIEEISLEEYQNGEIAYSLVFAVTHKYQPIQGA